MNTLERISSFKPKLNKLYLRMILGLSVEITAECRKELDKAPLGKWFFIKAIDCNEKLTIVGQYHDVFKGLSINSIKNS